MPIPDMYNGKYTLNDGYNEKELSNLYAQELQKILQNDKNNNDNNKKQQSLKIGTMIVESILGCAGQVPLPYNFLKKARNLIHKHGGLLICDEIQCGFARIGTHYWGFQMYEHFIPDIVTLGKPIGNGFPLGLYFLIFYFKVPTFILFYFIFLFFFIFFCVKSNKNSFFNFVCVHFSMHVLYFFTNNTTVCME